ncbi:MAG TPA: hypothetical protein VKV04_03935, partial [Verrucomicrobiae bacterium]|nr:hypothetical protein [Verrucomicrobiae bacterium]
MKIAQRAIAPIPSSFSTNLKLGKSFRPLTFLGMLLALALCAPGMARAASIVSGQTLGGTITLTGQTDTWTFAASAGQAIVVRVGNASTTNTSFVPKITLTTPVSTTQGTTFGAAAAEIAVTATNTGTFTVSISDSAGTHTGPYILSLALSGEAVTVSPGFQGGPMTNGNMHTGTVIEGGLEEWTFNATAGEAIVVRVGEITSTNSFTPWVRLYDPSGTRLGSSAGGFAAEIAVHATNSGTFVVVVGDDNGALSGSGNYRLTLAD